MILKKEQIHRFMRHIIMPEISGPGQKKLLDSSIIVLCEDLRHSAFMLYYLTAMGVGKITCWTEDESNSESLQKSLKSLNPDVRIEFTEASAISDNYDAIIVFNASLEFNKSLKVPFILAAINGNKGCLGTVMKNENLEQALYEYENFIKGSRTDSQPTLLNYPCMCLIGAMAAIEAVKTILQIGSPCENPLYVDLWDYNFSHEESDWKQVSDNSSNRKLSGKLKEAKVLIVGSGGLGSPVAYILAEMGIGKLGLVDFDIVDLSNLNRQILHSTDKIGIPKVESAKTFLSELNPDIEICTYNEKFSKENAESLIKDYDIIVDGLDNLPTRYLLNDTCYFLKKPLVEAGVLTFNGLATAIIPDEGPCYRCTFPEVEDTSSIPSCSETGVLGAVPGIMGALQAVEVIKQLIGAGSNLLNKIIMFDALNAEFTKLDIYKEESCPLCGSNPTIDALKDYNFACSSKK